VPPTVADVIALYARGRVDKLANDSLGLVAKRAGTGHIMLGTDFPASDGRRRTASLRSRVRAAMADLQAFVASRASQMQELGVSASYLISSAGFYIVIEPMMYWADQLDPLHMRYLSARNRERFGSFTPNPAGRELVSAMRSGMRDIIDRHGAVHSQLGRFYRLAGQGIPAKLMPRLKATLDPKHGINPGVLGLSAEDKLNAK
jgi:hypothetical protein